MYTNFYFLGFQSPENVDSTGRLDPEGGTENGTGKGFRTPFIGLFNDDALHLGLP